MPVTGSRARVLRTLTREPALRATAATGPVAVDTFWGRNGPPWIQIPYSWISPPITFRRDAPITEQTVTQTGGITGRQASAATLVFKGADIEMDTVCDADPQARANWIISMYANPRMRCSQIVFNLYNSAINAHTILGIGIGDRIQLTSVPATWPAGGDRMWVEGIVDTIGANVRTVTLRTSPLISVTPGTPDQYLRADINTLDGTIVIPW